MENRVSIEEFEKVGRNFWKRGEKRYQLLGKGITPNSCWVIGAKMIEVKDIDVASGKLIYGSEIFEFELGTVWASQYRDFQIYA